MAVHIPFFDAQKEHHLYHIGTMGVYHICTIGVYHLGAIGVYSRSSPLVCFAHPEDTFFRLSICCKIKVFFFSSDTHPYPSQYISHHISTLIFEKWNFLFWTIFYHTVAHRWVPGSTSWVPGSTSWVPGSTSWVPGSTSWVPGSTTWVP